MDTQMSLFDLAPDQMESMSNGSLKVVRAEFVEKKSIGWTDLFTGYDEMYGITFSSGIQFMEKVFDSFEHVEMIFGCEGVLNDDLATIISAQITYNNMVRVRTIKYVNDKDDNDLF